VTRYAETDTFVGPSHRCDTIWVGLSVGVTIQTVNTKRVTGKKRTRKNRQNLVGK
jgi:hypothetical protein